MTAGFSNFTAVAEIGSFPGTLEDAEDFVSLAPVVAGALARGLADAFELTGIAAILLSEVGSVLHVGQSAAPLLDGPLSIVSRHLVAETACSNRDLERLIAGAVAGSGELPPVVVPRENAPAIEVRAMHFADAANDPMQLMKAILVLRQLPTSA